MIDQDKLVAQAADFKKDARKRFDAALAALLNLAWQYKDVLGKDFSFEADPELYAEALAICREMSDGCLEDTKKRLLAIIREALENYDEDAVWDEAEEEDGDGILTRFDMAGSHLLELLTAWVVVAFANGFTKDYTRISIIRFLSNPLASGHFSAWGKGLFKWGAGYQKNIADQLALIGQNAIIKGARYAEWEEARVDGATYYIRRRGSTYDCDTCDEMANHPIPIEVPFEVPHARCCCYPEYHYEPIP